MRNISILISAIFIALSLYSCEDQSYKGNPHLIVTIADAPSSKFTSLLTSVKQVEIYDGTKWLTLSTNQVMFDLMTLTGREYLTLSEEDISEGYYPEIRLTFGDVGYISINGEEGTKELNTEAENLVWTSELCYTIQNNEIAVAEIDVDLNKSVEYDQENDKYYFVPNKGCRLMDPQSCGAVSALMVDQFDEVIRSVVQVNVFQDSVKLFSTYSNASNGKLFFRVPGGVYDLEFIPQLDTKYQSLKYEDVVVEDFEVVSLDMVTLESAVY